MNRSVIRIVGLVNGAPHAATGQFVTKYDATAPGAPVLETTTDPRRALVYGDAVAAWQAWRATRGVRPDGRPDRPLTAFTIEILTLDDAVARYG